MSAQGFEVAHHTVEAAAGADTLFLGQFLVRHAVFAIEFLPRAHNVDVVEHLPHPIFVMGSKIVCRRTPQRLKAC